MYPLYWTPSRGGIIMRYTYEYKRKCVELYREGKWPETPEGVSDKSFRDKVRLWVRAEDSRGPEALKHKNFNRNWTPEERLELVSQVMSGKSCVSVAIEAGIQDRLLYQWVQNYNHCILFVAITRRRNLFLTSVKDRFLSILTVIIVHRGYGVFPARSRLKRICNS